MTNLTIDEIEVMLATSDEFDFRRNLFVTNVDWGLLNHEADVVVMSKNGYLTEIEIKRSKEDLRADFKKKHKHEDERIKNFYFCVPEALKKECLELCEEYGYNINGIITYTEDARFEFEKIPKWINARKLFLEEQLQLARLGCMRIVTLKKRIIKKWK